MRDVLEWEDLSIEQKAALKQKSRTNFLNFTRVWFELTQGELMQVNWHHRMMADAVEEVINRTADPVNLIVNIPPGGTKTEFFSIHLPAYLYTKAAEQQIKRFRNLNISFSDSLVKRNSRRTRDLIASREFQELWPCTFGVNQAEEWDIVDNKNKVVGQTVSRAGGGQITGGRGGYLGPQYSGHVMLDDYDKPDDMFSETKRKNNNRKLVNTIRSRRCDKTEEHPTPIIAIQQRLHVQDSTGFMMSGGMGMKFRQIVVPALVDRDYIKSLPEPYQTMCLETVKDTPSVMVGDVEYWSYWPQAESAQGLLDLWEKDDYTFLSQYQQKPTELTGNMVDTAWFQRYEFLPELQWRAIYVDTNSGKVGDMNDFTVFTLAGLGVDGNMYIIDVERGKWDPEELLKKAIEVWDRWTGGTERSRVRYMAIEDKQAGQGLITTLKKKRVIPLKEIPRGPGDKKPVRCNNVIPQLKMGQVFIPAMYRTVEGEVTEKLLKVVYSNGSEAGSTDWLPIALKEVADFSADDSHEHDDVWDTWMDAIDDMLIGERKSRGFFDMGKK